MKLVKCNEKKKLKQSKHEKISLQVEKHGKLINVVTEQKVDANCVYHEILKVLVAN